MHTYDLTEFRLRTFQRRVRKHFCLLRTTALVLFVLLCFSHDQVQRYYTESDTRGDVGVVTKCVAVRFDKSVSMSRCWW